MMLGDWCGWCQWLYGRHDEISTMKTVLMASRDKIVQQVIANLAGINWCSDDKHAIWWIHYALSCHDETQSSLS
jgi:hypothetical protein